MNKKIIYTIVAKNYLALAKTLVESVKKNNDQWQADTEFYVFVADEFEEGQQFEIDDCVIIECKELGLKDYSSLAYKYDITEFCTALKPFCLDYLFDINQNAKIIYFDPDICVFSSLAPIFKSLDDKLCVLTPHYITPEVNYSGVVPEEMILWVGIFNLGFIAVNTQNPNYKIFIEWWKNRLFDKCYADKQDGLHTDQKWIDYIPSYFPNDVHISHNMGYNVSIWNLHERKIITDGDQKFYINSTDETKGYQLTFFHFSGFDIDNKDVIHKHHPVLNISNRPDMIPLLELYRSSLISNGINTTIKWKYSYGTYDNGYPITQFHRRLFRRMLQMQVKLGDPFSVTDGTMYQLLKANNLLTKVNQTDKLKATSITKYSGKIKIVLNIMKRLKGLIGIDKYSLLLKFLLKYSRTENQIFLIDELKDQYTFYNENRIDSINLK